MSVVDWKVLIILLQFGLISLITFDMHSVYNLAPSQSRNQCPSHCKVKNIAELVRQAYKEANSSIHYYDRKNEMAVMRLSGRESDSKYRSDEARVWLRSQRLIVAAAVRDAMWGLRKSLNDSMRIAKLFKSVTFVLVENDSNDETRKVINKFRLQHPGKVYVLGCGVNSELPCKPEIKYASTNRSHRVNRRALAGRTLDEESIDRQYVMAGTRNVYLKFIYENNLPGDLLLIIDADLPLQSVDQDILQGLYYFKVKPNLSSLCAAVRYGRRLQDPCTLIFHHNKYFYVNSNITSGMFIDKDMDHILYKDKRLYAGQLPEVPLKVAACYQGFTFYRMSEMLAKNVLYRPVEGEWQCEHTSLSKQLSENYYDTNMRVAF